VGALTLHGREVQSLDYSDPRPGDFILINYKKEAVSLRTSTVEEKGMVFKKLSWESKL
jgi:hypothetical protein